MPKAKNIKIVKKLKSVIVRGNTQSLVELMSVLVDNAVKYSPAKGKIEVGIKKTRKCGIVEVTDEGEGICKKDIPHIFDRFYRADSSRGKNKADGFGLGLSIAKSIVDTHRGSISVKSKARRGSTFKVILPV